MIEEVLNDPEALKFIAYRSMREAMEALEEYKINKKNIASSNNLENGMEVAFKNFTKDYIGKLPLTQKIAVKTLLSLPWSDLSKNIYEAVLGLGKKEDGSYKNTEETVIDLLEKYLG